MINLTLHPKKKKDSLLNPKTSKATLQESEQGGQGYHAGGASKAALEKDAPKARKGRGGGNAWSQ